MAETPNSLLFVYGTLMSSATSRLGSSQRARLQEQSTLVGTAHVAGRLFDLGRYPGLVVDEHAETRVWGEVVRLSEPLRSFRWLDVFEGIVPGDHDSNEYDRRLADVFMTCGGHKVAWVYEYRGATTQMQQIEDGRWPEQSKPRAGG